MTRTGKRFCLVVTASLAALLLRHAPAHAQKPVRVQVRLILASNEPGASGAAPELGDLAGDLRSLFKYNGYRLLSSSTASVSGGRPASVALPYGTRLEISPAGGRSDGSSLSVRWLQARRGVIVETQVRLRGPRPVLIGGPSVKDGVLIVALSLR